MFAGTVTASASANKFDAVGGVLEWEDLIILIFKPHKYLTVINMNVHAKDAALRLRILALVGGRSLEWEGRGKIPKSEWVALPTLCINGTNTILFLLFKTTVPNKYSTCGLPIPYKSALFH